ncbi:hypothetical protein [Paraburkholderia sp. SUR17]|uniref:hypothetical protein n=1 Tax=Paraburkholderia sp. SUR17 TaxID=3034358 RepID=UPI002407CCB0|nr:hypothetical protein [Paraburkholderia sp. SUR17]WEY38820.1 hypothetical protein P2869_00075 [Paraburkholderia sp. SUR17]
MKVLSLLWELWSGLSFQTKLTLCSMVVFTALGLPRTEFSLMWHELRVAVGLQNCMEDFTDPLMTALASGDEGSIDHALGPEKPQQLKSCGNHAIQHPEGTIPFVLDEYRRGTLSHSQK